MRTLAKLVVIVALIGAAAGAKSPNSPTDEQIINICGAKLERLWTEFGTPDHIIGKRREKPAPDGVALAYDGFILTVDFNTVTHCFFTEKWKGTIRGIQMGASREEATKNFGKPIVTNKDKEGAITGYCFPVSEKLVLWTNFDDEGKLNRIEIALRD